MFGDTDLFSKVSGQCHTLTDFSLSVPNFLNQLVGSDQTFFGIV